MQKDSKALLTVIIPTYKRADSLKGVIDSVTRQSFTDWCIFISDDNSPDNTYETAHTIIKHHENSTIDYHRNSRNLGEYQNVNQALSHCYGSRYVSVLQDDSRYIDMNYLAKAVELMENEPSVVYVASHHCSNCTRFCGHHRRNFFMRAA